MYRGGSRRARFKESRIHDANRDLVRSATVSIENKPTHPLPPPSPPFYSPASIPLKIETRDRLSKQMKANGRPTVSPAMLFFVDRSIDPSATIPRPPSSLLNLLPHALSEERVLALAHIGIFIRVSVDGYLPTLR